MKTKLLIACLAWSGLAQAADLTLTVDTAVQHQVIHGFGTCINDWSPNTFRKLYMNAEFQKRYVEDLGHQMVRIPLDPDVLPNEVADPKAISWKDYKFANPESDPKIRRPQYAVDWARAIYQRAPGQIKVFGSVWSPPHWMKEGATLKGANTCGGRLRPDRYGHFARYLAQWIIGLKETYGVPLYAVSIQNELAFVEPYHSCVYKPNEYRDALKAVARVFKELKIETKIMGPEDMTHIVNRFMSYVNAVEKDPEAANALEIFCSHGYYGGTISAGTSQENSSLWSALKGFKRELWMTETGAGRGSWEDLPDAVVKGKNRPQPGALTGLGGMLHNSLVYGNISVWTLWQITDPDPDCRHALLVNDQPTKKYFVTKHYSRFIRDGARRVEATPDGQSEVYVSAYTHEKDKTLTVVVQNRAVAEVSLRVQIKSPLKFGKFDVYRTSKEENCAPQGDLRPTGDYLVLKLPARSMVTVHGKAQP